MLNGIAILLGLALAAVPPDLGAAQNPFSPAVTVNEAVITHHDLAQRTVFLDALGASGDLRDLSRQQLTEERVKVAAGRALGIEIPPEAIEAGVEEFATQRGITVEDVTRVLAARNIDRQTLEDFVEAGLVWRELVGARFRARALPSEQELDAALQTQANQPVQLAEIAEIAIPFEERGEAETYGLAERVVADIRRGATSFEGAVRQYSRGSSAGQGGRLPPLPVSQLPPALRGQILLMSPGEVTEPVPISGGVAILRLVGLRDGPPEGAATDETARRERLREQLFAERITRFGDGYLQELMRDAYIVEQ